MGGDKQFSQVRFRTSAHGVRSKHSRCCARRCAALVFLTAAVQLGSAPRVATADDEPAQPGSIKAATIRIRPLEGAPDPRQVLVEVQLPDGPLYREPDPSRLELFRDELVETARLNDLGREHDREPRDGVYTGRAMLREAPDIAGKEFLLLESLPTDPSSIDPERSILIRHLNVVQDATRTFDPHTNSNGTPGGEWTFATLMKEALGAEAPAAVLSWLRHWEEAQPMDGADVAARDEVNALITLPWLTASGGETLDLDKAPFRLLAIVNRLDLELRQRACPSSGGELRFVFGLVSEEEQKLSPRGMSVIFEYDQSGLPPIEMRDLARQWIELAELDPATDATAFNAALADLTSKVTTKPGTLKRIRTSELDLAPTGTGKVEPWEMRSFAVENGALVLKPLEQTPLETLNRTSELGAYVTANADAIQNETHCAPEKVDGARFLGWSATMFPRLSDCHRELGFFWSGPADGSLDADHRFAFSRSTCNGCHSGETATRASHVDPTTPLGKQADLSMFLTEAVLTVADPSDIDTCFKPGAQRTFTETPERKTALAALADLSCSGCLTTDPYPAAH